MPPTSSLAEYLAKNYLTADTSSSSKAITESNPDFEDSGRPKKKRKKHKPVTEPTISGLIIADDDPPSLSRPGKVGQGLNSRPDEEEEDDNSPFLVGAYRSVSSALFQKKKKTGWKKIGVGSGSNNAGSTGKGSEQDEADRIIASAAAENVARRDADNAEDAPALLDDARMEFDDNSSVFRMESGARAGLQTAEQTAAMVAAQERRRKAESVAVKTAGEDPTTQETIYRDASGRVINVAMKRAEARRAAEEEREKEERKKEALMGDVQRQQKESRRQELQEARSMPLARTIDDDAMNEELRARERWNDPAAHFLATKKTGKSLTGKPLYTGAFAPNRYGIRPGHRWDGVDRSTGFEKEWFQARARKERVGALEYAWQMDE